MLRDELLAEIETIAPVVREYASQSNNSGGSPSRLSRRSAKPACCALSVRTSLAVVKPTR